MPSWNRFASLLPLFLIAGTVLLVAQPNIRVVHKVWTPTGWQYAGDATLGDTARYQVSFSNIGTDTARYIVVDSPIDTLTCYVPLTILDSQSVVDSVYYKYGAGFEAREPTIANACSVRALRMFCFNYQKLPPAAAPPPYQVRLYFRARVK